MVRNLTFNQVSDLLRLKHFYSMHLKVGMEEVSSYCFLEVFPIYLKFMEVLIGCRDFSSQHF